MIKQNEYAQRINRVIDYIEQNYDKDINLDKLADVANFSKFHFHRIFGSMTGEPVNRYIQRIRLERAATRIAANANKTITEVAIECGFSGSSVFSRKFKEYFGCSPTAWKNPDVRQKSKIGQKNSNPRQPYSNSGKDEYGFIRYFDSANNNYKWSCKMNTKEVNVEIKDLPEIHAAYIRHVGPYQADEELFGRLFDKLFGWAAARDLLKKDTKVFTIYHNDPSITEDSKLMMSVCVSVPEEIQAEGEIGRLTVPAGKYAMAKFELTNEDYGEAWELVYGKWFPESGYEPDDRPCFELYHNDHREHPEGKHIVSICAPVKPM